MMITVITCYFLWITCGSYDCGLAYTDFSDDGYGADEDAFVFSVSASL